MSMDPSLSCDSSRSIPQVPILRCTAHARPENGTLAVKWCKVSEIDIEGVLGRLVGCYCEGTSSTF